MQAYRSVVWTIAVLIAGVPSLGAESPQKPLWLSAEGEQPPRLYLFWQSGWDPLRNPAHVALVSGNRPDLFQYPRLPNLSTGVPHDSSRPAPGEYRERWWYEKDAVPDAPAAGTRPQWWTTEQYAERVAEAADAVRYVTQATGAYGLAPYVCAVKMEGEPDKRLRYWAFYDHWDLYRDWYGAKPDSDPWEWIQLRADYNVKAMWGFYQPVEDGSRIYSGCPNSPFSGYLASLIKIVAQNGVRGVFVDNPGCHCICGNCQQAWQAFLRERFNPQQLQAYFGIQDYAEARLDVKEFEVEAKRFWARSVARHLAALRQAGESVWGKGNFWICPNGSPIEFAPPQPGCNAVEWARQSAFQLGVHENNRMWEGFQRIRLTLNLWLNASDDLILGHKMLRGLGASQAWAAPLRSHEFLGKDEGLYNLAAAETLAFDGCLCDTGPPWDPCTARKPFYAFYRTHESLLRSGQSLAEVGVLSFTNELYRDPADSIRECMAVTDWLSEARVLWDAVMDDNCTRESLASYRVVFVPNVRMLDDEQCDLLLDYVRGGGRLVLSGEVGTAYRCGAERKEPAFEKCLPPLGTGEAFAVGSFGAGKIAYCPKGLADVDLPADYRSSAAPRDPLARSLIRECNRDLFLKCLSQIAGQGLSAILPPGPRAVRIAARWFPQEDGAVMTVHLANYDLQVSTAAQAYYRVLRGPSQLTPASHLRVVVPVPPGFQAAGATWAHLPTKEMEPLEFEALRDGICFTLPRVDAYGFVAVPLSRGRAAAARTMADLRGQVTSAQGTLPAVEATGPSAEIAYAAPEATLDPGEAIHVVSGIPVITSGTQGQELEIRIGQPGEKLAQPGQKEEAAVWTPAQGLDTAAATDRSEVRWLRFWLISPSGRIATRGAFPLQRPTVIRLTPAETGLYCLMTEEGMGSLAVWSNGRALMASGQPLRFEDPNARLYFHVPRGVAEFRVTSGGLDEAMYLSMIDASGAQRFERDDFHVHHKAETILVPPGQDGKAWSLRLATKTPSGKRAGQYTQIELGPPLSGFVSPNPARLVVFELTR